MSITYCHNCGKNIDEDVNFEHFDVWGKDIEIESNPLMPPQVAYFIKKDNYKLGTTDACVDELETYINKVREDTLFGLRLWIIKTYHEGNNQMESDKVVGEYLQSIKEQE